MASQAESIEGIKLPPAAGAIPDGKGRPALYLMLGFSAGLPFYMFSTVLSLRLQADQVALAIIGFFAWVQLLPTFKFAWAPLLDRYEVPGFSRFWGKRRGWIMLSQTGIVSSLVAMPFIDPADSLALTALFAILLAFWTTTLEVAADGWRIELAPTPQAQGPLAAATLWGYRTAMVAAGSGAMLIADQPAFGWTGAYLAIAAVATLPLPVLAAMRPDPDRRGSRSASLAIGMATAAFVLVALAAAVALIGWLLLEAAMRAGISADTNVTPWVLILCGLPFLIMAAAVPKIRRLPPDSGLRRSVAIGPYVEFFWRYGFMALVLLAFVSVYRMGDVLALNLSKPMIKELGYSLSEIGRADSYVALIASIVGVGLGGWMAARWRRSAALATGAIFAAIGNFGFVWLAHQPPDEATLYFATAADQFGNGMAGTIFVVYLSLLCDPRHPGAQYAFLSGFAFLLPRLLSGSGGAMVTGFDEAGYNGYDIFFLISGIASLAALAFLPLIACAKPRPIDEEPA